MIRTVIIIGLFALAKSQIISDGNCPELTTQDNFNLKDYTGTWYEIGRYEAIFEKNGECSKVEYSMLENGTLGFDTSMIKNNNLVTIAGNAYEANPDLKDGKLKVSYPAVGRYDMDYFILDTDYTSYSVMWSCTKLLHKNLQFAWILGRNKNLSEEMIDEVVSRNGIDKNQLRITKQDEQTCVV